MDVVKYVAFYDINREENRQFALSATNKINYICKTLVKNNYKVEIVSPSWTNNISGYYKGRDINIGNHLSLKLFNTFGAKSRIGRILKYIYSLFQLVLYLLLNSKKGEQVIVYHSVLLYYPLLIVKLIKQIKIVLEVEEIYQDAQNLSVFFKKSELKAFSVADKFLLSTELLNGKLNSLDKPYVIIYGNYEIREGKQEAFTDDKIHLVYSGTFDPQKGGANLAISIGTHLSSDYHVHIIGFGSSNEIEMVKYRISEVVQKSKATITYDGLYEGEDYINFLKKCHIGLSTQSSGKYNESSFPSKILSYLSSGLKVVTARIKVLEVSSIKDSVIYFNDYDPVKIAEVISSIDLSSGNDPREVVQHLDKEFIRSLKELLETK